ncbi:MAG: CocE/NonD family hydrolase [Kineosporiaceae bacterium]
MTDHVEVSELVEEVETAWIPMRDGRRLAARLFLPSARTEPAPVVLEYIPYRRRDGTRLGDEAMHRWFAAQGFACARVDVAGTGDSEGFVQDEYAPREQDDGLEVIAWLASQPWSSGAVGMIGISWGGFNALQIAARRPPALRAVISLCSTVDRYRGDVHFTGGCLNEENLEWGAYFFTMQGLPPDPEVVGEDRWRQMWRHRIDQATLPPAQWLRHQRRDSFWKHGSVVEDLSAVEVPVLAVSGWADGYTGGVFDLVEGLRPTARGIIGPWGHKYPQDGVPGPAIGFLQEATRWWDRWLRGVDTGVETDPAMRMWLQESVPPEGHLPQRPGRWIGMDDWRPDDPPRSPWLLGDGRFGAHVTSTRGSASVCSPQTTGLSGGQWCAYGLGKIAPELPLDQRDDDAGSLVFDSDVLVGPLHLIGRPSVRLRVSSDQPTAFVAVRLNDVHPDGTSERLSYGILNLCHRDGHEEPAALEPGQVYEVEVSMKGIAQTVPVGHRVRLAISTSHWPMIWPSPHRATVMVHEQGSAAFLPTYDDVSSLGSGGFGPPQDAVTGPVTVLRDGRETRWVRRDLGERTTQFVASRDDGVYVLDDIGTAQSFTRVRSSSIGDGDPTSARADVECRATYRRDGWDVRVETDISLTCTAREFVMTARLGAYDGGELFAERRFEYAIDRDHV